MDTAYIRTLSAGKISAGNINVAVTMSAANVTGGTLNIGAGTFLVSSNGAMTASAARITGNITATAGTIGGFNIGSNLTTGAKSAYNDGAAGVFIGSTGIGLGSGFSVSSGGTLNASSATISGNITATSGYIGNGASGFAINNSHISNNKNSISDSNSGVYIGTDGISLGIGSTFRVTSAGALTATSATIAGAITATSGFIGNGSNGFVINSTYIGNGKTSSTDGNNGIYIGTDAIGLGPNSAFRVTNAGAITATSGTIGGWTISSNSISTNNVVFGSNGNIRSGMTSYNSGTGWYLGNDGTISVGNSAGNKLLWTGTRIEVTGGTYITDSIGVRRTDDSGVLTITGGSGNATGGQIDLVGNSAVSNAGSLTLSSYGSGFIQLFTGGSGRLLVYSNGNASFSNEVSAQSFNSTSSRRFKTNVSPITGSMDLVNKLQGVTFDWKDGRKNNDIGFIAEEVDKILPAVVFKSSGVVDAIDYSKIVALLTEALKEQNVLIKDLQSRIDKLENK